MEIKKSPQANLENSKFSFLLFGFAVSIGLMLLAFTWASKAEKIVAMQSDQIIEEDEMIPVTQQEQIVLPPPQQEIVIEEIEEIEDEEEPEQEIILDSESDENEVVEIVEIEEVKEEAKPTVFAFAEQMPEYPGGDVALRQWIAKEIIYPPVARENDIQGKVYIRFVVTETGKVANVTISRGADPILDEEAVRVVSKLPNFKPGKQGGKNVSVYYSVPINFSLK